MKRIVLALMISAMMSACGPKLPPETSPEAKLAVQGNQVVQALRAALPTIKTMTCTEANITTACLPPQEALEVVGHIEGAAKHAQELGNALAAYDAATDAEAQTGALAKARSILTSIQHAISLAQIAPENQEARAAIVTLLGSVSNLLFTIGGF